MGKKKIKPKKKYAGPTLLDKLPNNEGEHIELMIKFTLRGISDPPVTQLDRDMLAQAERLKQKLENWRKNESKNQTPAS
jgi:hypothetical protein